MGVLYLFFIFILGVIVGSFLNVIAVRYNTGVGIGGRSFCFSCSHKLAWYDLIPLLSFIFSFGKCRYCKSRISYQYMLVEIVSGLLFLILFLTLIPTAIIFFSHGVNLIFYLIVFSILLIITIYDITHKIIPDGLVYSFNILALISALGFIGINSISLWGVLAGPLLAIPLALLWFISGGAWIGLGDAKLVLGIGWLLGLSHGFAAILISFWIGAIFGLIILAISKTKALLFGGKHYTMKSEIPFGPFLILGTFLVFVYDISYTDIQSFFIF